MTTIHTEILHILTAGVAHVAAKTIAILMEHGVWNQQNRKTKNKKPMKTKIESNIHSIHRESDVSVEYCFTV